jgi:hypothetical protein
MLAGQRPFPTDFVTALSFGVTLNPINYSVLATVLTSIANDFLVAASETELLLSVLYFVSATCPPDGRMANQYCPLALFPGGYHLGWYWQRPYRLACIVVRLAGGVANNLLNRTIHFRDIPTY